MKRGLKSFFEGNRSQGQSYFEIETGKTKVIRFLEEIGDIATEHLHFVKTPSYTGWIKCFGKKGCLLCVEYTKNPKFGADIGAPQEVFFTPIIERGAETNPKLFRGTRGVAAQLSKDDEVNGSITDVDYSYSKVQSSKGKYSGIKYTLDSLRQTVGKLTEEDKALGATIDIEGYIAQFDKSKEEVEDILNSRYASENTEEAVPKRERASKSGVKKITPTTVTDSVEEDLNGDDALPF